MNYTVNCFVINTVNYKLNYKNKITKDFSKSFFVIIQEYRKLKNILKNRNSDFAKNPLYKNQFKAQYLSIISNAELYLEENNNLKNIKELVNTLFELENDKKIKLNADSREVYLRKMYAVDLPASELQSNEAKDILGFINKLEQQQYIKVYAKDVYNLNSIEANDKTLTQKDVLMDKVKTTNCK